MIGVAMRLVSREAWRAKLSGVQRSLGHRWQAYRRRLADQIGQTLAEYAMIVSLVAAALIVFALVTYRDNIAGSFSSAASCVQGVCSESSEPGDGDDDDDGNNDNCNDGHGNDGNTPACND